MPSVLPHSVTPTRIAFVGGGNMARSLIGGLLRTGFDPGALAVAEPHAGLREALQGDFGICTTAQNSTAAERAAVVVLAVKPQVMRAVCVDLSETVQRDRPVLLSIAAGIRMQSIEDWAGGRVPVVRCMPNTPALIGAGASGLCANSHVDRAARALCETILGAAGVSVWIDDEAQMDIVTALSGSGPAYFFLLVEALEDAAVAQGLPRETARNLATQTALGAGRMLREDGEIPSRLRERVTSPNGTTQAALEAFAAGGLRALVATAVEAATQRGRELAAAAGD
ncbi:MAG: pyrroline-5-carboxylate reductase [Tahibacter sp.]